MVEVNTDSISIVCNLALTMEYKLNVNDCGQEGMGLHNQSFIHWSTQVNMIGLSSKNGN